MSRSQHDEASRHTSSLNVGPYTIVPLLQNIPLSEDGGSTGSKITCAEFWNDNLYVGTSAAELLHYVLIPPASDTEEAQFILATRLTPEYLNAVDASVGIQRIVLLPAVGKATILCNGTLTFYSLPELSPAFPGTPRIDKCTWVGGVDEDEQGEAHDDGPLLMVCVVRRIRLIRVGEDKPRQVRTIEVPGCLAVSRIGTIACVADSKSYSLLEVAEQQRIPLFEINPQNTQTNADQDGNAEKPLPKVPQQDVQKPHATETPTGLQQDAENTRQRKSGEIVDTMESNVQSDQAEVPTNSSSLEPDTAEGLPKERQDTKRSQRSPSRHVANKSSVASIGYLKSLEGILKPNIVSPTPSEFLMTTGTSTREPGVGIFVNLDGDVVRGTIQFSQYPESIITDGSGISVQMASSQAPEVPEEEGFILAIVYSKEDNKNSKLVEIQRWDVDEPGNVTPYLLDPRQHIPALQADPAAHVPQLGLAKAKSGQGVTLAELSERLRLSPLQVLTSHIGQNESSTPSFEKRLQSELSFANRLGKHQTRLLLWTTDSLWLLVRSPVILRLDSNLDHAVASNKDSRRFANRKLVEDTLQSLQALDERKDPQSELGFVGARYIRQKASLILFHDLLEQGVAGIMIYERDRDVTGNLLAVGEIDPRVIITSIDELQGEVKVPEEGVWVQSGLHEIWNAFTRSREKQPATRAGNPSWRNLLQLVKRFLWHWRRKKGYASVSDDETLFQSVDAALLRILLILDTESAPGRATKGSVRSELNGLVDEGLVCFERATELLENHNRLYTLSRLYQGRKQYDKVLHTWKRIVEGEQDASGELGNGEQEIHDYVLKRKDKSLVQEYGIWLARRNPKLGVQVFSDPKGSIGFSAKEVVELLKSHAPGAVKEYLEQLVFGQKLAQYANDLIGYYLDSVIQEIESSQPARDSLSASYEAYRALTPPKPTYSTFASDNAVDASWWRNRLRLLQLLGGSHVAASKYDTEGILERVEPYKQLLVPETIILSGRQGRHEDAMRLLTHGLGDYDTAVSYCVLGGASTYSSIAQQESQRRLPSHDEQEALFKFLLQEFLSISDLNERTTQTTELLGRFAGWFSIEHILATIPENWSVDTITAFLESALRLLQSERAESMVVRALTSSQNLSSSARVVEKIESMGATVQHIQQDTEIR